MLNAKKIAFVFFCLHVFLSFAQSAVVITIDISNPDEVIFAATGAEPLINDTSSTSLMGVTFIGIFNSAFSISAPDTLDGDLEAQGGLAYRHLLNGYGSSTAFDLNIYAQYSETQNFSTLLPAFSGSSVTAALSGAQFGESGDIIAGDTLNGSGAIIGQWAVIPEPSTYVLISGLLTCLATLSRRVIPLRIIP